MANRKVPGAPGGECDSPTVAIKETSDFVHFVIHMAANASGNRCELCLAKEDIRYVGNGVQGLGFATLRTGI